VSKDLDHLGAGFHPRKRGSWGSMGSKVSSEKREIMRGDHE
jgi:hypothetical protein